MERPELARRADDIDLTKATGYPSSDSSSSSSSSSSDSDNDSECGCSECERNSEQKSKKRLVSACVYVTLCVVCVYNIQHDRGLF